MPAQENRWSGHVRRILYVAGTATSVYLVASYALDRMREARIRASKERKERDMLKNHFTSLISTISFTLYALLPTLQPQVGDAYPVEMISQALQGLSTSSSTTESTQPTPDSSMVLQPPQPDTHLPREDQHTQHAERGSGGVEASWSSEFKTESVAESEQPSLVGDSMLQGRDDDVVRSSFLQIMARLTPKESSTLSQSISLPPTDISSSSPSPTSDVSHLHPSPPRALAASETPHPLTAGKSKKELWRELKVQTLTRTLTTAYLIPLLYLLTSSQLSTLARIRYLDDVQSNLPDLDEHVPAADTKQRKGLFGYFSTDAMGLNDFVESATPGLLNPRRYLPSIVSQYLPFASSSVTVRNLPEDPNVLRDREEQLEAERAEDERVYLMYSWWILHEGWRGVARRVEEAVEEVFGSMQLKRELSVEEWENHIRQVRVKVETSNNSDGTAVLYFFLPHLLPPSSLPELVTADPYPLPLSPPTDRSYLCTLLEQTTDHLTSADATFLIEKGVSAMIRRLVEALREESYAGSEIGLIMNESQQTMNATRRLVDCLPSIDRWGKGVWEGVPDSGIENLTSIPEFEGFAALVFGDWAPRDE